MSSATLLCQGLMWLAMLGLVRGPSSAQPVPGRTQQVGGSSGASGSWGGKSFQQRREAIKKRFDTDGDGSLSDLERQAARERMTGFARLRQAGASGRTTATAGPGAGASGTALSERGQQFFRGLETRMGKPLSQDQRLEIGRSFQTHPAQMGKAKEKFARTVSGLTGVPVDTLRQWMPPPWGTSSDYRKDLIARIEAFTGRKVTAEQMAVIQDASKQKNDALHAGKDRILDDVTRTTGLGRADVDALLPHYD